MAKIPEESINADSFKQQLLKETQLVKDCCEKSSGNISELLQTMLGIKDEVGNFLKEIEELNKKADKGGKSDKEENKDRDRDYRLQHLLLKSSRRTSNLLNNINQAIGSRSVSGAGGGGVPTPTQTADWFEKMMKERSGGTGSTGGGTGGGDGGGPGGEGGSERGGDFASRAARRIANLSSEILGGWSIKDLFSGAVRDVTEYRSNMRMLAYETEGMTEDTRGLQDGFASLGDDVVASTGQSLDETQKAYEKILRKGVRSRKDSLKVVKTGLHAATMLGANAEQTAEVFGDWHRTLGMSTQDMDQLARDSKDIARATGVTGDELVGVMKKSEGILRNLKNQGNLTSSAAKNVIRAMAEAEKLGIGDLSSTILSALSNSNKFFTETDEKTKRFLVTMGARMGKLGEMQAGTFLKNRKNFKMMAGEMEGTLAMLTQGRVASFKDIDKLGDTEKMILERQLQAMFGMSIDEFRKFGEEMEKSGKPLSETFTDLQKELDSGRLTAEERIKIEKQMNDLMRGTGMNALNEYSKKLKDGMSTQEAASAIFDESNQQYAELRDDINDTLKQDLMKREGLTAEQAEARVKQMDQNPEKKMQEVALVGARKLQEQAQKEGVTTIKYGDKDFNISTLESELRKAMAAGDENRVRELNEVMAEAQKQIDVKEKTGSDPLTQANQQLKELNEVLRNKIAPALGWLVDALGATGIILLGFGASIAGFAGYLPGLVGMLGALKGFGGFFKGFGRKGFGGGGGGGGPFGFLSGFLDSLGKNLKGIVGLALLAGALFIAGKALQEFANVKWSDVGKGIVTLTALAAVAFLIGKMNQNILMGVLGIAALSGALWLSSFALREFANVEWSSILKGAAALIVLGLAGVLIGKFISNILMGAVGILAISAAMWVLGKAMQAFAGLSWETLAMAGVALVGFAIAAGIMGIPPIFAAILLGAVAIGALGLALGLFGLGLIPVAYAMNIFMDAFNSFINGIKQLLEVDSMKLLLLGPALAMIGIGAAIFAVGMAAATAGSLLEGLFKLFGAKSPIERIKEFVPVADQIASIGKGFKDFGDGIKGIAENIGNLDGNKILELKDKILEFLDMDSINELELMAEHLGKIAEFLREINNINGGPKMEVPTKAEVSGLEMPKEITDEIQAKFSQVDVEQLGNKMSNAGEASVGDVRVEPGVQPKLNADVTSSLLRDKTSAESGGVSLKSDELSNIEAAAEEQNTHLIEVTHRLEKIAELLRPTVTAGDSNQTTPSTKDKRVPAGAYNMGTLKYNHVGNEMQRGTINAGFGS